jgi:exopolysaccharide production protein ExoZ
MFRTPAHVPRNFLSLQYLRAAACLILVTGHAMLQIQRYQPDYFLKQWEAAAVDIFFVLSGFVMWHVTAGEDITLREYARRRFARAVPFYWLVTSLFVAGMLIAPSVFASSRFDLHHVAAAYLLLPWPHPVLSGQILPVIIPGWTFEYEIFFYALLGLCLAVPLRHRAATLIALIMAIVLSPLALPSSNFVVQFYTQPILLEFASGIALGWLVWNGHVLRRTWGLVAFVLGCLCVRFLPAPLDLVPLVGTSHAMVVRVAWYCVPSFAIVGGLLSWEIALGGMAKWKLPKLLGDASYSVYIIHPVVVAAGTHLWNAAGLMAHPAFNNLYLLLVTAATCVLGIVCYHRLEMPIAKYFARLGAPKQPAQPEALPNGSSWKPSTGRSGTGSAGLAPI